MGAASTHLWNPSNATLTSASEFRGIKKAMTKANHRVAEPRLFLRNYLGAIISARNSRNT
jgi:hypothetical protein